MPINISDFESKAIKYVFTDIDDTLTHEGKLHPEAYESLWRLFDAGIKVIPVTGRPAGWCEMILRFWPVEAVIGENGGFYFIFDNADKKTTDKKNNTPDNNKQSDEGGKKVKRHFFNTDKERAENKKKLEQIKTKVLKKVPGSAVASDQFTRLMDLAIDFCEDVPALSKENINTIVKVFEEHGAQAKVSSIHVNGWFGDYNKVRMIKEFCRQELGEDFSKINPQAIFVGDSPNDQESFEAFENSIGVKNIESFLPSLTHPPKWITNYNGGLGFKEVTDNIL